MDMILHYSAKLVPNYFKSLPFYMDFEGQKRAEWLFQIIISVFGAVGFVWGYICQQFSQTLYIVFAGFLLSCLLTLPPWPMYRRHPLKWRQASREASSSPPSEQQGDVDGKNKMTNKKKKKTN